MVHTQSENPEPSAALPTPPGSSECAVGPSGGPTLLLAAWPHLQMAPSHSPSETRVWEMLWVSAVSQVDQPFR